MSQCQRQNLRLGGLGAIQGSGNCSTAHHGDAVAHSENLRKLGRDHQDSRALRGKIAHQCVDLGLRADVNPLRRLIQDEDRWFCRQPSAQGDFLLIAP